MHNCKPNIRPSTSADYLNNRWCSTRISTSPSCRDGLYSSITSRQFLSNRIIIRISKNNVFPPLL